MDILRISLHVLAATIWVGGQFTLLALLPVLRAQGGDAPKQAAKAFNRIAWPAFGVLLLTGLWNLAATDAEDERGLLVAKLAAVVLSGAGAFLHTRATSRAGLAIWGAVGALAAVAAVVLGVALD